MTRKVRMSGAWVDVSPDELPPWPRKMTSDMVSTATSVRGAAVTATGNATPFTAPAGGGWVEIDASLSEDIIGLMLMPTAATALGTFNTSTIVEIGIGASGSEVHWAYIGAGYRDLYNGNQWAPGYAAAGSRMSLRVVSAAQASKQFVGAVCFIARNGLAIPSAPQSMGFNLATAAGVILPTPGSTNVKTAWTEIEDNTAVDLNVISLHLQGGSDASFTNNSFLVDVAVGDNDTELNANIIIGDWYGTYIGSSESVVHNSPACFGVPLIPAGSRIAARYQTSNINCALDVALVGCGPT